MWCPSGVGCLEELNDVHFDSLAARPSLDHILFHLQKAGLKFQEVCDLAHPPHHTAACFLDFWWNKEPTVFLSNYHESRSQIAQLFTSRELFFFWPKQTGYLQVPVFYHSFPHPFKCLSDQIEGTGNKMFHFQNQWLAAALTWCVSASIKERENRERTSRTGRTRFTLVHLNTRKGSVASLQP